MFMKFPQIKLYIQIFFCEKMVILSVILNVKAFARPIPYKGESHEDKRAKLY